MGGRIRVGVVGVGHVGQHHARIYAELPQVELVAIVDINPTRLAEVGRRVRVPGCEDYREILDKVEAVSIAVPTVLHYRITKDFLMAGVHVLVEKPIAGTVEEAEELVEAAKRKDRILQVGHIERFNRAVRALETLVEEPGFIECHRLSSFPGRGTDVDVVLDLMIHDLDVILSLVKSPVVSISAVGVPVISDQVDIANARLQFASGCVANVTASRVSTEKVRRIRIFQRETHLSLDYSDQKVVLYRYVPPPPGPRRGGRLHVVEEEVSIDKQEPLRVELESFIECVRTGKKPVVSGEEGLEALKVASQILRKLR